MRMMFLISHGLTMLYDTGNDDTHYATKANGKWNHVQLSNLPPNTYNTEIIQFDDGDLEIIAAPFNNYRL